MIYLNPEIAFAQGTALRRAYAYTSLNRDLDLKI
jgi:hypothetical protein